MPHRSFPLHPAPAAGLSFTPGLPELRIGLLGLGTVGAGTLAVLRRNHHAIARRTGRHMVVTHVAARNVARAQALAGPDVQVLADAHAVATHPDVDVVVEAVGGTGPALDWVLAALASGKHVVTANKALLAEKGHLVFEAAERHGRVVAFEGAVAVSIPIIKSLREGLGGNRIEWLAGIINGTSNFILSAMRTQGLSFDAALAQAQALGYAEADPAFDIHGHDATHKLTLLAAVAFGMPLRHAQVHTEGIAALTAADSVCAQALGHRIKLLGIARRQPGGVELRVHPAMIPADHLLAQVEGSLNGILVQGDASGPTVHCGAGAGGEQTASAIVADLMDIARLGGHTALQAVPMLGVLPWATEHLPVLPMADVVCRHCLRIPTNTPGALLAPVLGCLHDCGLQTDVITPVPDAANAPGLLVLTRSATERAARQAVATIGALGNVSGPVVRIRVESLT
ncbi:MAG TPA: homoserine dehydrogenase [Burkholderiaceae bacterium]|nr:homoserine dehydrogenase [Burkholderiaceae bacterium]